MGKQNLILISSVLIVLIILSCKVETSSTQKKVKTTSIDSTFILDYGNLSSVIDTIYNTKTHNSGTFVDASKSMIFQTNPIDTVFFFNKQEWHKTPLKNEMYLQALKFVYSTRNRPNDLPSIKELNQGNTYILFNSLKLDKYGFTYAQLIVYNSLTNQVYYLTNSY